MVTLPAAYYENLKRYWRRRNYQRLGGETHHNSKKQRKVSRLGGGGAATTSTTRRLWSTRRTPKFHIVSPLKLLAQVHDAYVDTMICLANKMVNPDIFRGKKKVAKARQVSLVSSGEKVDSRLVMEIYTRVAASRQSRTEL